MSKRYRNTERRKEAWYRRLPARVKLAWDIINDDCDSQGIWPIDMELVSFQVGEDVTLEEITAVFPAIVFAEGRKLFLSDFVAFQQGDELGRLSRKSKWHQDIARKLTAEGLPEPLWKPLEDTPSNPTAPPIDTLSTPCREGGGEGQGRGRGEVRGNSSEGGVGETNPTDPVDPYADAAECAKKILPAWARALGIPTEQLEADLNNAPSFQELIIPELRGDFTPEARKMLSSVTAAAQQAWLKAHDGDAVWIRKKIHELVAKKETEHDRFPGMSAGARIGRYLAVHWDIRARMDAKDRARGPPGAAAQQPAPDYSQLK